MHASIMSIIQLIDRCRSEAPWLAIAFGEQGVKESPGLAKNNPRILEYIGSFPYLQQTPHRVRDPKTHTMVATPYKMDQVDETAWCACFVAWCLRRAGQPTNGMNAGARGWLNYGLHLGSPRLGAITVVHKKHASKSITSTGNHVAFYMGGPSYAPTLFGGNQGNRVCAKDFHGWTILGYRWPSSFPPAQRSNVA
jgi:uncharacterized protein (TIGR02594 family)